MRLRSVLAVVILWAIPLTSQVVRERGRYIPHVMTIGSIDELRSSSEILTRRLEADAFASTRMAAAAADLESDFRTSAALAKARGRIEEARLRVSQTKDVDPRVGQILSSARELLLEAERNSGFVDVPALQKELQRHSGRLQRILYDDLHAAQKVRKAISDMQKSLNLMGEGLDAALEEALGAMFAYLRSGGE